jgi:hypothetical protein
VWVVQRHTSAALYPSERIPGTHGWEAGWARELVWTQRLEENFSASGGYRIQVTGSSSL